MKSIKEKAREYYRVIEVINENESIVDTKGGDKFIEGANYVLEQIDKLIYEKHVGGNLPLFDLTKMIDKLKEK